MTDEMAQYDVFENPNVAQRPGFPYVVVIQSDHFTQHTTSLVMPVVRLEHVPRALPRRLSMQVIVRDESLHLAPHLCAPLPIKILRKPVTTLRSDALVIRDALDALMSGV